MKNLVYFGSPDFSAVILESLIQNQGAVAHPPSYVVCGVVTQPDKPQGRKQILTPSPVAVTAMRHNLPVFKPEKLDGGDLSHLKLLKPDLGLVVSYGKIIPSDWLNAPSVGTFNLHFSLLPKYRGALCISEAIKNQDGESGVTLMKVDEGMDTGPVIYQEKVSIDINDNCESLTDKLTQVSIKLLAEYLPRLTLEKFSAIPQDNSQATYTPTTKTRNHANAFIPWSEIKPCLSNERCLRLHALIRSLNPEPGAWTKISLKEKGKSKKEIEVKIIKTSLVKSQMVIELVQLPGKSPISWQQFQARTKVDFTLT